MEPAVVVGKAYVFMLWLLPKAEKFPRSYRFTVGERLVSSGLDLLLALVDAAYSTDKSRALETAAQRINAVRYLMRLSKDLKLLPVKPYEFASEQLEEIGRMAGGWRKSVQRKR